MRYLQAFVTRGIFMQKAPDLPKLWREVRLRIKLRRDRLLDHAVAFCVGGRTVKFGEHLYDSVLEKVPHRHCGFTLPKPDFAKHAQPKLKERRLGFVGTPPLAREDHAEDSSKAGACGCILGTTGA